VSPVSTRRLFDDGTGTGDLVPLSQQTIAAARDARSSSRCDVRPAAAAAQSATPWSWNKGEAFPRPGTPPSSFTTFLSPGNGKKKQVIISIYTLGCICFLSPQIIRKKKHQRRRSPIHENVVLRSSGGVPIGGGGGAQRLADRLGGGDLLAPDSLLPLRPLQCLQPHARDPSLRLAAPSHRITSAILTPPSIMH